MLKLPGNYLGNSTTHRSLLPFLIHTERSDVVVAIIRSPHLTLPTLPTSTLEISTYYDHNHQRETHQIIFIKYYPPTTSNTKSLGVPRGFNRICINYYYPHDNRLPGTWHGKLSRQLVPLPIRSHLGRHPGPHLGRRPFVVLIRRRRRNSRVKWRLHLSHMRPIMPM